MTLLLSRKMTVEPLLLILFLFAYALHLSGLSDYYNYIYYNYNNADISFNYMSIKLTSSSMIASILEKMVMEVRNLDIRLRIDSEKKTKSLSS